MKPFTLFLVPVALLLAGCATTPAPQGQALENQTRLKLAEVAERSGSTQAALNLYAAAAAAAPADAPNQITYARALLRSGNIVGARDVLLRAAAHNPGERSLPRQLGVIDTLSGDTKRAIAGFDRLLASDPQDWKSMVDKGVALDVEGNHAGAQALYRKAMTLAPHAPAVATDYAVSLMLQGKPGAARTVLAPYFDRYDAPSRTRVDLAIVYAASGEPDRTKELLSNGQHVDQVDAIASALALRGPGT